MMQNRRSSVMMQNRRSSVMMQNRRSSVMMKKEVVCYDEKQEWPV